MTRSLRSRWVVSAAAALGLGEWAGPLATGQPPVPTPPPPLPGVVAPGVVAPEGDGLLRRLTGELRDLGDTVASDLGATPQGPRLLDDTRELGVALAEARGELADPNAQAQAVQTLSGVDGSLHQLLARLAQPGVSTEGINVAAQRVIRTDALVHRAFGLNAYPPGYYGGSQPLTGMAEVQRLAHALNDRAEALAAVARLDAPGAGGPRLVQDAVNLARAADAFHDAIDLNAQAEAATPRGFATVDTLADRVQADLTDVPPTPRLQAAWQAFRSTEVLVRQALGMPNAPAEVAGTLLAQDAGGVSPVVPLADQLLQQVTAFVQVFSQTAGAVPEGGRFLADAQALQAAAADFRQDAARGLPPNRLAYEFRDVDAVWQRLARRTNRIARGRTGPNIQQVRVMGQTLAEIHRLLGIPGYAPVLAAPAVLPD